MRVCGRDPARVLSDNSQILILLALLVVTVSTFYPVAGHEFIKYDDGLYVTRNSRVQQGLTLENVRWAFTTTTASNWHPLTWLSHMLDVHLFGLNAGAHHLVNLLLHVACVLLLFITFRDMTGAVWRSALVAALFAVHPTHVESVAWIAERKDMLSTFFWFLTILAYIRYVRSRSPAAYLCAIIFLALGLLAKPMLVTLPFVLLLLDYWPLERIHSLTASPRRLAALLFEKTPFFLFAAASSYLTYYAQEKGGSINLTAGKFLSTKISSAVMAYGGYLKKSVWPADLAVFYPFSLEAQTAWKVGGTAMALLLITFASAACGKRWKYVPVGWLWFVGTLVPVAGLVKVGVHSSADRYLYIPLTGLAIIAAWGIHSLTAQRARTARLAVVSCLVVVALFAVAAHSQARLWQSTEILFRHALNVTSGNWLAHTKVGNELYLKGDLAGAAEHYEEALKIDPMYVEALNNLGSVRARQGDGKSAVAFYSKALRSRPDDASIHYNMGNAFFDMERWEKAESHYRRALEIKPDIRGARAGLRDALARQETPQAPEGQALQ